MLIREYLLNEVFDRVDVRVEDKAPIFITSFIIDNIKYRFGAEDADDNGIYDILFYRVNDHDTYDTDEPFKSVGDKKYAGKVVGGVFESIRLLMRNNKVNGIRFNTNDNSLIKAYDKLQRYIEGLGFKFDKREIKGDSVQWTFLRGNN